MLKDLISLGLPQAFLEKFERLPAILQEDLSGYSGNSGNPDVVI
jgi:hypothetical protein